MHPLTEQALHNSLTYTGYIPQWFTELVHHCHDESKPTPEIIDSFVHHDTTILVTWLPASPHRIDRSPQRDGYRISAIEYYTLSGERIGYVKAIYATTETIAQAIVDENVKPLSPTVDFSKLEPAYRNQELAPSLYVYLARKLADQNMTLASSTVQSDEAIALWNRILSQKMFAVTELETSHGTKYVMDFRESNVRILA